MDIRNNILKYANTAVSYGENNLGYAKEKKLNIADSSKVIEINKLKDTETQIRDFFRLQRYINNTIENIQQSYSDIQKEMLPSLLKLKEMVFRAVKSDIPPGERMKIQNEVTEIRAKINEVFASSGTEATNPKDNIVRFPNKLSDSATNKDALQMEDFSVPELSVLTENDAVRAADTISNLISSVERKMASLSRKKEENTTKLDEMGTATQKVLGDENKRYSWDEMQKILAYTKQKMFADANQAVEAQGNFSYQAVVEVLG